MILDLLSCLNLVPEAGCVSFEQDLCTRDPQVCLVALESWPVRATDVCLGHLSGNICCISNELAEF